MIAVIKTDLHGVEQMRYGGMLVSRNAHEICIQAPFGLPSRDLGYIVLRQGDMFTEWFYADHWFNIFQINASDDSSLKGFYCNLARPAVWDDAQIVWADLALDVFVHPDGTTCELDRDEYDALNVSSDIAQQVAAALAELLIRVHQRMAPFDTLSPSPGG